jgi:hypothetical protein
MLEFVIEILFEWNKIHESINDILQPFFREQNRLLRSTKAT